VSSAVETRWLGATGAVVETMIPRRLDHLPWSRRHVLVAIPSYADQSVPTLRVAPAHACLAA
jgi:hypothetical protein